MSIRILFLSCAVLLASCGGNKVISKEEMAPKNTEVVKPVNTGPQWPGPIFKLDIPTELFGPRTAKLVDGDLKITANRYGSVEFAGERTGWGELTLNVDSEYKTIRLDEEQTKTVLGYKVKLLKASEKWDAKRSDYVPLLNVVISR